MSDFIVSAIPKTMIDVIWGKVHPHIIRPIELSHGEVTEEEVRKSLSSGKTMLIVISEGEDIIAVNTLDVRIFDSGKRVLYIPLTGGDKLDLWMPKFLDVAKAIARDYRCEELRGLAVRKGWMKKLAPMGWEEVHTVISCNVGEVS